MSNNKQSSNHIGEANKMVSSVDWLVKEINQIINFIPMNKWDEIRCVVQQAKAMHKAEHLNTWLHCLSENDPITFEQYYNETYGGNK